MLPIPLEYISSVCEVKTLENDLVCTGTINDVTDDYIEITDRTGKMPGVMYGLEVKVNIYNSKQGFRVVVGTVYTSSDQFIRLVDISNILDYERRHFFRVETKMFGYMKPAVRPMSEDEPEEERVTVRDISLGGALIETENELHIGDRFKLRLNLAHNSVVFSCAVRRIKDSPESKHLYGCAFDGYSDFQSNILCAYIFQRQKEHIHKHRHAQG